MKLEELLEGNPTCNLTASYNIGKKKAKDAEIREKAIATLTKNIESAKKKAESINTGYSGGFTPKRDREASHRDMVKYRLEEKTRVLKALKKLWEDGTPLGVMEKFRSISEIEMVQSYEYPKEQFDKDTADWYKEECRKRKKIYDRLGVTKENIEEIRDFINENKVEFVSAEEIKKRELERTIKSLRYDDIPGFFPTTPTLANRMMFLADIENHHSVYEPNAGIGSLLDPIRETFPDISVTCSEINYKLADILTMKGYPVEHRNMYDQPCKEQFDRIIMNPPFENLQDIDMVTHCFEKLLKPNGVLVSIMSSSVKTGSSKKHKEFQSLVETNGSWEYVEPNAFKNSLIQTNVNVCIVRLIK